MIYTPVHGRWKLEGAYLIFQSIILNPTQVILMKVTHRDQKLFYLRAPVSMTQAMGENWKIAPFDPSVVQFSNPEAHR